MSWLSPRAEKNRENAQLRRQGAWRRMKAGPYLRNGNTVVVPSEDGYYSKTVINFWKGRGHRWDPGLSAWVRTIRNRQQAEKYLQEAREAYYALWRKIWPSAAWPEAGVGDDGQG